MAVLTLGPTYVGNSSSGVRPNSRVKWIFLLGNPKSEKDMKMACIWLVALLSIHDISQKLLQLG